jgi:hypothetical protein
MFKANLNVSLLGYNRNPLNELKKIISIQYDSHIKQTNTLHSKIRSASVLKKMVYTVTGVL